MREVWKKEENFLISAEYRVEHMESFVSKGVKDHFFHVAYID